MTRRQFQFIALAAIVALISILIGATHAAPVAPPSVTPTWMDQHALVVSWQQQSDANKATVLRCSTGASCYLVAGLSTRHGLNSVTDRNVAAGDVYWIGEFISADDGSLTILGWTGPIRVPDRPTYLPSISAGPAR